jgi:transglutaminase-like putative cysteine protease
MRIRAGYEITFECPAPVPMLLMLSVHPSRRGDLVTPDRLTNDRGLPVSQYVDGFGNLCSRVLAPAGYTTFTAAFEIEDSGEPDPVLPDLKLAPVEDLPDEVLIYLLGSRYCETDRLSDLAWSLFGAEERGWPLVQSIVRYTNERITFGYEHARPTRSAWEGNAEGYGVCRDYAHLAIAFCRCMNVPARYCTGYLGDIGVPARPPGDFSAWFEAWLDGAWRVFDARHDAPRIGRILMATGRDATDAAITTNFGPARLASFRVDTDECV